MAFADIKAWEQNRRSLPLTDAERLDDLHSILKARIGQKGLDKMFRGGLSLPIETPGLREAVLASSRDRSDSARGHRRTLLYADRLHRGGRFEIEGINSRFRFEQGDQWLRGDRDLALRSRVSGKLYDVEVKNRKESSLLRDMNKLKQQVGKEMQLAHANGRTYVFVNRNGVPPQLRHFIESQGGYCVENLKSNDVEKAMASIDRPSLGARFRAAGRVGLLGIGAVGGLYEMYTSGQLIATNVNILRGQRKSEHAAALIGVGQHGIRFAAGMVSVTETVAGGLVFAGVGTGSRILTVYVPGVGLLVAPVLVAGEGVASFARWQYGYISDGEFRRSSRRLAVQATGLAVGGMVGGVIGSMVPGPGTLVGAGIGSGVGYGVASVVAMFVDPKSDVNGTSPDIFGAMTSGEQDAFMRFVREHFGTR
jgi:hypothetical protein